MVALSLTSAHLTSPRLPLRRVRLSGLRYCPTVILLQHCCSGSPLWDATAGLEAVGGSGRKSAGTDITMVPHMIGTCDESEGYILIRDRVETRSIVVGSHFEADRLRISNVIAIEGSQEKRLTRASTPQRMSYF